MRTEDIEVKKKIFKWSNAAARLEMIPINLPQSFETWVLSFSSMHVDRDFTLFSDHFGEWLRSYLMLCGTYLYSFGNCCGNKRLTQAYRVF